MLREEESRHSQRLSTLLLSPFLTTETSLNFVQEYALFRTGWLEDRAESAQPIKTLKYQLDWNGKQ